MKMFRLVGLSVVLAFAVLMPGGGPARAAPAGGKPPGPHAIVKVAPRSVGPGGTVPVAGGRAGVPARGRRPAALKASAFRAFRSAMDRHRPVPAAPHRRAPAKGIFVRRLVGSASAEHGHSYWNGSRWVVPLGTASRPLPRLLIPRRPTGLARIGKPFAQAVDPSTQVDSATAGCPFPGANESSVAQSSDNPNLVVVAAQAFMDGQGNCSNSHP